MAHKPLGAPHFKALVLINEVKGSILTTSNRWPYASSGALLRNKLIVFVVLFLFYCHDFYDKLLRMLSYA